MLYSQDCACFLQKVCGTVIRVTSEMAAGNIRSTQKGLCIMPTDRATSSTAGTSLGTATSTPQQPPLAWSDLPDRFVVDVIERLPPNQAAAVAATCRRNNRLVEEQPHLGPLLVGQTNRPPPKHPHASLHRLTLPYGGLKSASKAIEGVHRRAEVLNENTLWNAATALWAEQEAAGGTPKKAIKNAARKVRDARQNTARELVFDLIPIKTLPPLVGLATLENLSVSRCRNLTSLPENIARLTALKNLEVRFQCWALKSLPQGINKLTALEQLTVDSCPLLTAIPEGIGDLKALTELTLHHCTSLEILPASLGGLTALRELKIICCESLTLLPESLSNLTALRMLQLSGCQRLDFLPENLFNLRALRYLGLSSCARLRSLPEGVVSLTALTGLDFQGCFGLDPQTIRAVSDALPDCSIIEVDPYASMFN